MRGPWMASLLSSALLPLIVICSLTGFLSHVAYYPELGSNSITGDSGVGFDLYFFDWPTTPAWLYAFTQGLHVISGVTAIPILLAKLWVVIPKLFEWPPARSIAHAIERLSLLLLVGGSLFVFFTGIMNIQLYAPWSFPFVPAHYYGAFVFLGALAFHIVTKLPTVQRKLNERSLRQVLRENREQTEPEPPEHETTAPVDPVDPSISRRGFIGAIAASSVAMTIIAGGQVLGGPFRRFAILAPHGRDYGDGPNDFQVNKTAELAGIKTPTTGPSWRLTVVNEQTGEQAKLSRDDLLAMTQYTEDLPIACVEGWSTTQTWTGVRLRDLAEMVGAQEDRYVQVESLQEFGAFRQAALAQSQFSDDRSLLALKVNGADISLDHGFPARIIVPALPGVHNTKWVNRMTFRV